jgi:hypothetical protein
LSIRKYEKLVEPPFFECDGEKANNTAILFSKSNRPTIREFAGNARSKTGPRHNWLRKAD